MIFYEEILSKFQKAKVEYLIAGGIACNLLGGSRNTFDLDILINLTEVNLKKILSILKKEGYQSKLPVNPLSITNSKIRKEWIKYKNLRAFNFYKPDSQEEVDLLIASPITYEEAKKKRKIIKIYNLKIPVVSIDHLIRMKKAAARPIDELDIANLKEIKKSRRKK